MDVKILGPCEIVNLLMFVKVSTTPPNLCEFFFFKTRRKIGLHHILMHF